MRTTLLSLLAVVALAACGQQQPTNAGSPAADASTGTQASEAHDHDHSEGEGHGVKGGKIGVATALYPIEWLTKEIGGDHVAVTNLVPTGQDAHHVELSPSQVQEVTRADVIIRVDGLSPELDEAAHNSKAVDVDIAKLIELEASKGGHDHDHGEAGHEHGSEGHDHEHGSEGHDHEHGSEGHDHGKEAHSHESHDHAHDHGGVDPHFWLNPAKLAELAPKIAHELEQKDEANAKVYEENAKRIADTLTAKHQEWDKRLDACQIKPFVTTHAAFGYLASAYGLEQVGIKGIDPDAEPGPEHLQEVRDQITKAGVTTVFTEPSATKALAEGIAEDIKVEVGSLDPLESLSPDSPGKDYLEVMQANIDALAKANKC